MKKTLAVFIPFSTLVITSLSFAAAKPDGAALLKERCGACHAVDRATEAKKSKSEWEKTVSRMISKGAKLSADEKSALVNHLAKTYKP